MLKATLKINDKVIAEAAPVTLLKATNLAGEETAVKKAPTPSSSPTLSPTAEQKNADKGGASHDPLTPTPHP